MKKRCHVDGCGKLSTTYGIYCPTHKAVDRRHGSPTQKGITKAALKPFCEIVEKRIRRNERLMIWEQADRRWEALVGHAADLRRTTINASTREAANEIVRLAQDVPAREIVVTVLAVYLMQEQEPYRFKTERAFRTQLVRRVRALAASNAQTWVNSVTGRKAKTYRELPPRVTQIIAGLLIETLGQVGVWVAQNEVKAERRRAEEAHQFKKGLQEIDFT